MGKVKIKEKGITLVSLVVTIIVLLILAGITITILIGQNGIISREKNAVEKYKIAQENENKDLLEFDNEISKILNNNKEEKEIVEVELKTSLNHSENFDGIIITLGNKSDISKTQEYEIKNGEKSHTFEVDKGENYSVKVTKKEEELYTFEEPEETQIYTAESERRTIEMIYKEKESYLYKNGKENEEMIGTFNYKKTNHSASNSGTGSYKKNSNNMTVSVKSMAGSLMISDKKVNVEGYSKLYVKANITNNDGGEVYKSIGLVENNNFQYQQVTGLTHTKVSSTGGANMELSVGNRKEVYIVAGMASAWKIAVATMQITEIKLIV